jgi:hypothetical protein
MGGSKLLNGPEWLVSMCLFHNQRLEDDAVFAEIGRQSGWKLQRGEDPLKVAVYYRGEERWRLLDAEGNSSPATARDEIDRERPEDGPLATWKGPKK